MLACLFDARPEILQKIALFAVISTPLGPPRDLYSLSLVCHASFRILSLNSTELYTQILTDKFDVSMVMSRLGKSYVQSNAKVELRRRFRALDIFLKRKLDDPWLTEALWIAYFMLEDSYTSHKNIKQLLWAGLPAFLDSFLRKRLYEGSSQNNGWPLPNVKNSLAVALLWLLSSECQFHLMTTLWCLIFL
jgi:hypothetical protein